MYIWRVAHGIKGLSFESLARGAEKKAAGLDSYFLNRDHAEQKQYSHQARRVVLDDDKVCGKFLDASGDFPGR